MANLVDSNILRVQYTGETWMEWIVFKNNFSQLWDSQPTFIISQIAIIAAGLATLVHALKKGGRWPYFWLGTVIHGLYVDNIWHFVLPAYDNFWHSQAPIMILGARLPLHIILLYPAFIYQAAYAVSHLKLHSYAEPFAVGLLTVLLDIPYDIVAVKFVHWTWHDTDPNIYDRTYWVPWNSYYFHATFAASFYFFFIKVRSFFVSASTQWESASKSIEWKTLFLSAVLGMPGGILMFVPLYHPLHDQLNVHSGVTFFLLLLIFIMIVLKGSLNRNKTTKQELNKYDYVLILQLAIHYIIYWVFVMFFNPENEVSTGLHEPVGPCNETSTLITPFGHTLKKRTYFCPTDYNEGYFDFHCVGGVLPANGTQWYTVCGTPFESRSEYIAVISIVLLVAGRVFYEIYFGTQQLQSKVLKQSHKDKPMRKYKSN